MSEIDEPFYTWLAAQPAFVEVALGVVFVTFLAPGILAAVATALSRLECWFCARWEMPIFDVQQTRASTPGIAPYKLIGPLQA
jgi:hypothetical protein